MTSPAGGDNSPTFAKQNLFQWTMFTKSGLFFFKFPRGFYYILYTFLYKYPCKNARLFQLTQTLK